MAAAHDWAVRWRSHQLVPDAWQWEHYKHAWQQRWLPIAGFGATWSAPRLGSAAWRDDGNASNDRAYGHADLHLELVELEAGAGGGAGGAGAPGLMSILRLSMSCVCSTSGLLPWM